MEAYSIESKKDVSAVLLFSGGSHASASTEGVRSCCR